MFRCSARWVGAGGVTMSVCMSTGVLRVTALKGSYSGLVRVLGEVCMCRCLHHKWWRPGEGGMVVCR